MEFEFFIAKRYLRSRRRENFISVISMMSAIGVAIGVAALVFVLSMMNGFESEVRGRIIATAAHVTVYSYVNDGFADWEKLAAQIEALPDVVATAPHILYKTVIGSRDGNDGVFLKGIIPEYETNVSELAESIIAGRLDVGLTPDSLPGILLGRELASTMGVIIGDEVVLASLKSKKRTLVLQPKYKKCQVTGIFETGFYEYDANLAYISLASAQRLLNLDDLVTGLQVKVTNFYRSSEIASQIEDQLGDHFFAIDWTKRHKNLFSWMTLEKYGLSLVVGLIIAVAAFNIISSLIMLVLEKRKDIAILKSMGATRGQIMRIFVLKGTILGTAGALAGTLLGYLLCWLQETYNLVSIPGEFYFISSLPIEVRWWEFGIVALATILISFLSTLYPSRRAARLFPVDILRHG
ncbi:MAG: lipoprotein-releasing ABC transporter permease subunit [candidate division Zixibacteria bacterium]|nr:lipoprotein-releasing ABC transporter permease subunit [candidate division Zixibacteria bacterium]